VYRCRGEHGAGDAGRRGREAPRRAPPEGAGRCGEPRTVRARMGRRTHLRPEGGSPEGHQWPGEALPSAARRVPVGLRHAREGPEDHRQVEIRGPSRKGRREARGDEGIEGDRRCAAEAAENALPLGARPRPAPGARGLPCPGSGPGDIQYDAASRETTTQFFQRLERDRRDLERKMAKVRLVARLVAVRSDGRMPGGGFDDEQDAESFLDE